jgi:serine/threonine protein kinase/Tol biopolymer transport system component
MSFTSGSRLGPYEIQSLIGAGGMGEVYRARDPRLQRVVAIKILPQSLASDHDRLDRFQREARILSTLNHPNVMAIHDVGSQDGVHFLVSEFLEGQTLRERLQAAPLPQRRVNEYSLQIAKALAAAHEKGIVHRDLKPENIFILPDERVKVLDFGLAKQVVNRAAGADQTLTNVDRTSVGTVLGTAGYMSPEQVRGEPIDHRSDIFSFGTVLYEMVSGRRAFHGDSGIEVMNSILKEEPPDLAESGVHVPLGLQRIAQRCLEKKPEARFQSASDLAFALDSLSSSAGSSTASLRALKDTRKTRFRILVAASLLAALAIGVIATLLLNHPQASHPAFTQITFRSAYLRRARFAPDGRTVVYDGTGDGKPTELFSTRTDTAEAQSLNLHASILSVSSTGELAVLLNPDFVVKWTPVGRLARVPLGGGTTRELLDNVTDADWAPDGSALAVSHKVKNHFQLEFPPGKVLYQNEGYISDLRFSRAGDKIAFIDHSTYGDDRGVVDFVDLRGNRKALTQEFSSIQGLAWAPDGSEIWFTAADGSEPRSLRSVNLIGKQRTLLSSPAVLHFQDISKDGDVLINSDEQRDQQVFADTRNGQVRDFSFFPFENLAAISRDSRMFLLNTYVTGPNSDYNLYTQATDGPSPALIGQGAGLGFSSDGKWALALDPVHLDHLRIIPTGVGESSSLSAPPGLNYIVGTWMPDGKQILVVASAAGHAPVTYLQDIPSGAAHQITHEGQYAVFSHDVAMSVSPDGQYFLTTDGGNHYWIQPIGGGEPTEIKSLVEGDFPLEWHNGSQNIFFERRGSLDAIDIYDLNLANGQQKLWTHFSPTDKTAMVTMRHALITPDGAHSLYAVQRIYSTLFVAKNIR